MKKKRKKVRVAFRKNRRKPARARDFTREALDEGPEADELTAGERIGKGEMTRHRTIVSVEADQEGERPLREVDESQCLAGRIVSAVGLHSLVQAEDGRRFRCSVRRVVRSLARDERNAVVTGDRVNLPTLDLTTHPRAPVRHAWRCFQRSFPARNSCKKRVASATSRVSVRKCLSAEPSRYSRT
jgi:hypothetical protein